MKNFVKWTPRILAIIGILFFIVMSFDVFESDDFADVSVWRLIAGFLIHMIPAFVLIAILILSWFKSRLGGIAFLLIAIVSTLFFQAYREGLVFIFVGILPKKTK